MTDPTKAEATSAPAQEPNQENPRAESPSFDAPPHEEPIVDVMAVVEAERDAALAEARAMKDRLMRTLAEMENLRKRTEREVADARTYGVTSFARDLLTVADAMGRALESLPAEAEGAVRAFAEGIVLTDSELQKVLAKHGVKPIEPNGQRFDPNLHQAMFEVPNTEVPNGTVVTTVQAGYVIGERVLRPALVGVSKGGPKAAPAVETAG